jgi:hypothetical protein
LPEKERRAWLQVCGGVYLQLWDGMKDRYIDVPLITSVKDWQRKWFIIR